MFEKLNRIFYLCAYSIVFSCLVAAGLHFAILKNKHTLIQREINTIEQSTRNQKNLLTQYQADLQSTSNRFLLKERIKSNHTDLKPIQKKDVITIPAVSVSSKDLVKAKQ